MKLSVFYVNELTGSDGSLFIGGGRVLLNPGGRHAVEPKGAGSPGHPPK